MFSTMRLCLLGSLALLIFATGPASAIPAQDVKVPEEAEAKTGVQKGLDFSRTAAYKREFAEAIRSARQSCKKHRGESYMALVSDIDETLLDNREFFRAHPQFKQPEFRAWIATGRASLLKPTAELLSWARQHGFAIFLVTGRREGERAPTISNLVRERIAYDGLYMRPDGDERPAAQVKPELRQQIEKLGFKIVVSIGDQWSDLTGGHAEDCEKIPNQMYFIR